MTSTTSTDIGTLSRQKRLPGPIPPVSEADLAWWLTVAPTLTWRTASTMPEYPHAYVVRREMISDADYLRAMGVVLTFGRPAKFHGTVRIYLVDEQSNTRWWLMSRDPHDSFILNTATNDVEYGEQDAPDTRPAAGGFTIYDALSAGYDERYDTPEAHAENREMWRLVTGLTPDIWPSVLDVGAGTGLALDLHLVHAPYRDPEAASKYRAVDPAQGMLNELVMKHPWVTDVWPCTFEQYLTGQPPADPATPRHDLVLSMFGAASYLRPESVRTMPALARRAVVLMHYREGYYPDYYDSLPPGADESRETAIEMAQEQARDTDRPAVVTSVEWHDFQVTTLRGTAR